MVARYDHERNSQKQRAFSTSLFSTYFSTCFLRADSASFVVKAGWKLSESIANRTLWKHGFLREEQAIDRCPREARSFAKGTEISMSEVSTNNFSFYSIISIISIISIRRYIDAWQLTLVGNNGNKWQLFQKYAFSSVRGSIRRGDPASSPVFESYRKVCSAVCVTYMHNNSRIIE